jgi:endonuclease YncB( thermonuclease family)
LEEVFTMSPRESQTSIARVFKCTPIRAVDGDTFEAFIHLGFGFDFCAPVRILGIDTPEIGPNKAPEALKCKAQLQAILDENRLLLLEVSASFTDKYGRALATVKTLSGENIVTALNTQYLVPPIAVAPTICGIPGSYDSMPQPEIVLPEC